MWDSGVRQALKRAAHAEGCDFPGFGPHSLRRANITWRQEVGGSSIETSKIAGHANTKITEEYTIVQLKRQEVGGSSIETSKIAGHASTAITEEYTFVQLKRQDELTRRIQDKRAKAAKKDKDLKLVKIA